MTQTDRPLTNTIVSFCRFLRAEGFNIGMRETFDAVQTAQMDFLVEKARFKAALRSLLCTSQDDWHRFDTLFDSFWIDPGSQARRDRNVRPIGRSRHARQKSPLLTIGAGNERPVEEEGAGTTGASAMERLRKTDFSEVSPYDRDELSELVARLARQMRPRLSRRLRSVQKKVHVDLRRTIRRSIGYGGDPVDLRYRGPKRRKPRLVALLDVSGSMDRYSFFLLQFIHALRPHFERVEAFVFSTRLERVSAALHEHSIAEATLALGDTVGTWSSGTRIGDSLETFNRQYGRIVTRDTIVLILSDGLDAGEPALLARELDQIRQRARKLIWLNPLSGMKGYEPTARGMAAALPLVDAFVSAHSLDSLLDLETHLSHV